MVEIGSKYNGPPWDRPCLRQLPREWTLEEAKVPQPWFRRPERWTAIVVALLLLLAAVQSLSH